MDWGGPSAAGIHCETLMRRRVYRPEAGAASRYEERYRVYRSLYPALKGVYPAMALAEEAGGT